MIHTYSSFAWRPDHCNIEQALDTLQVAPNMTSGFWSNFVYYGTSDCNSMHLLRRYFIVSLFGAVFSLQILKHQTYRVSILGGIISINILGPRQETRVRSITQSPPTVTLNRQADFIWFSRSRLTMPKKLSSVSRWASRCQR